MHVRTGQIFIRLGRHEAFCCVSVVLRIQARDNDVMKAIAAPCPKPDDPLVHLSFYKFILVEDPDSLAVWLRRIAASLRGSILVATEGINGVVAGAAPDLDRFTAALGGDPRFVGMVFKRSGCMTVPFGRLKVSVKPEIVSVGLPDGAGPAGTPVAGGVTLDAQAWRRLIREDDVVVLDNRNSFEFRLGRFHGAIDPGVSHFRDFPRYVAAHAEHWQASGKRVAMYCTGGIRCEKISGWMQHELGLEVYQLDGGILNYFQMLPDAERDWEGECFVFDNRIALDTRLRETSTTPEDVYAGDPDSEWRLQRARRLDESAE